MTAYAYHRPRSIEEAFRLQRENPGARFIAGGTDLMVRIRSRELRPQALISLRSVPGLAGVKDGDPVEVGALTTISELIESPLLGERFPVLVQAARRLGGVQIRNAATIGGNLCNCSPCADTATPLLVLGARVRLQSAEGTREIPIEEFFVGPGRTCSPPGELLTAVLLPVQRGDVRTVFCKKGRVQMDLAIASTCVLLDMDGTLCRRARIAAGSCAEVPLRLRGAEAILEGKEPTPTLAAEAAAEAARAVSPISDVRASAGYRRRIISVYVRRSIAELVGREEP